MKIMADYTSEQERICEKYGVELFPVSASLRTAIADNVKSDLVPINGLRHPPYGDMNGWFLWAGEQFSEADDFFKPICSDCLPDVRPEIMKYLGLPPGWRFLIVGDYEDVWFDEKLLNVWDVYFREL